MKKDESVSKFEIFKGDSIFVKREKLLRTFLNLRDKKIFFLFAPPGSGKTYFLAQIKNMFKKRAFYYRLDERDNEIEFLVKNLALCLENEYSGENKLEISSFLQTLSNKRNLIFMFDNFHKISHNPKVLKFFSYITSYTPSDVYFLFASRDEVDIEKYFSFEYKLFTKNEFWFTKDEIKKYYWKKFKKRINNEELNMIYEFTSGWPIAVSVVLEKIKEKGIKEIKESFLEISFLDFMEKEVLTLIPKHLKNGLSILALLPEVFRLSEIKDLMSQEDFRTLLNLLKFLKAKKLFVENIKRNMWSVHSLFLQFLREKGIMNKMLLKKIGEYYKNEFPAFVSCLYLYAKEFEGLKNLIKKKYYEIDVQNEPIFLRKILESLPPNMKDDDEFVFLKGIYYRKKGEYKKSFEMFSKISRKKKSELYFDASFLGVDVKILEGDFKTAQKFIKSFLKAIPDNDIKLKSACVGRLGSIHLLSGEIKKAEKYYKKALEIIKNYKNIKILLPFKIGLAISEKEKGVLNKEEFFSLLSQAQEIRDVYNYCVILLNLAELFFWMNEIEKAYHFLEKAKFLAVLYEEFIYISCLEMEARIKIFERKFDEAEKLLKNAALRLKEYGSVYYISPYFHLSYLYVKKGEYERAKEILRDINERAENSQILNLKFLIKGFLNYLSVLDGYKSRVNEMEKDCRNLSKLGKTFEFIWLLIYLIKALKVIGDEKKVKFYSKKLDSLLRKFNFKILLKEKEEVLEENKRKTWIQMFGEFKIIKDGREVPLSKIKGEKTRKVLKFFFMNLNSPCVQDMIIENFWRNMNVNKAKNSLYFTVSELRKFFKENSLPFELVRQRDNYVLKGEEEFVDTYHFLNFYKKAFSSSSSHERLLNVEKALKLYKDEYLSCERYSDFCMFKRDFYKEKYIELLLLKSRILVDTGKYRDAEEVLKKTIEEDPVNIEAYRLLIECLKKQNRDKEIIKILKKCNKEFYLRLRIKPPKDLRVKE